MAGGLTGTGLPHAEPGMRIGLFGGSFNPPHAGHRAVSLHALRRLALDRVWWLVAPQNPLKDPSQTGALDRRVAAAREVARHPRLVVTDLEARIGSRYTADTIRALLRRWPRVRFVWIMGADGFAELHRWQRWRELCDSVPLAVIDRPGFTFPALSSPAARRYAAARLDAEDAGLLAESLPPAWCFLTVRRRSESSTALRRPAAPLTGGGLGY